MAMESTCRLQVGKDSHDGRVRMEADHIDFAGATKYRFRIAEITHPRRESDAIRFSFHGNPVSINLDDQEKAEHWIEYILHPRSLADKLGVRSGATVRVLNLDDGELMTSLENKKTKFASNPNTRCDMVMLGVERASELRQIGTLTDSLRPDGAIWVVLPKSVRTVTKANVCAAAREAGMKHVDMVDFSDNRAAYKIVRPAAPRKKRIQNGDGANGTRRLSAAAAKPPRRTPVKA